MNQHTSMQGPVTSNLKQQPTNGGISSRISTLATKESYTYAHDYKMYKE